MLGELVLSVDTTLSTADINTNNHTITSGKFVKQGGTSSQYLMADGSVTTASPGSGSGGGTSYTLPTASDSTLGGIKTGYTTSNTNRKYKVEVDGNGNAYVNVPWTDTVGGSGDTVYVENPYTLPPASSSTLGGIKLKSQSSLNNWAYSPILMDGEQAYVDCSRLSKNLTIADLNSIQSTLAQAGSLDLTFLQTYIQTNLYNFTPRVLQKDDKNILGTITWECYNALSAATARLIIQGHIITNCKLSASNGQLSADESSVQPGKCYNYTLLLIANSKDQWYNYENKKWYVIENE